MRGFLFVGGWVDLARQENYRELDGHHNPKVVGSNPTLAI